MTHISVLNNGQIVLPERIRKKYRLHAGTRISLIERDQDIVFKPVTKETIRRACGMLRSRTSAVQELLEERQRDKRRENAKV